MRDSTADKLSENYDTKCTSQFTCFAMIQYDTITVQLLLPVVYTLHYLFYSFSPPYCFIFAHQPPNRGTFSPPSVPGRRALVHAIISAYCAEREGRVESPMVAMTPLSNRKRVESREEPKTSFLLGVL